MPITVKQNTIGFKDSNGKYHYANTLAEKPTTEYVKEIKNQGTATLASIPSDYTALSNKVSTLESKLNKVITWAKAQGYTE